MTEWRSIANVPSASSDEVIVSRRIDYVSSLYARVFEVDREAVRSALYRWKDWRNVFLHKTMRNLPSSNEMRVLEESEHIQRELIRLHEAWKAGRIHYHIFAICHRANQYTMPKYVSFTEVRDVCKETCEGFLLHLNTIAVQHVCS